MKYIRTKDGRIIENNNYIRIENNYIFEKFIFLGEQQERHYGEVFKQADNIEELCDELVSDNRILPPIHTFKRETRTEMLRNRLKYEYYKGNTDVKGAIWTDKGLIYVAKMNEKGNLCLL